MKMVGQDEYENILSTFKDMLYVDVGKEKFGLSRLEEMLKLDSLASAVEEVPPLTRLAGEEVRYLKKDEIDFLNQVNSNYDYLNEKIPS